MRFICKLRFVPRLRTPLFRWAFRGKFRAVPRLFRAPTARETSGTGAERPFRACSATRGARSAVPPEPLVPRPAEPTGAYNQGGNLLPSTFWSELPPLRGVGPPPGAWLVTNLVFRGSRHASWRVKHGICGTCRDSRKARNGRGMCMLCAARKAAESRGKPRKAAEGSGTRRA